MSRRENRKRNSTGACRRMIQSIVTGCCEAKDQSELSWTLQDTKVNRITIYLLVEWDSKFSANSDKRAQASILFFYSDVQYIYHWVKNIYTRLNIFRLTQMSFWPKPVTIQESDTVFPIHHNSEELLH